MTTGPDPGHSGSEDDFDAPEPRSGPNKLCHSSEGCLPLLPGAEAALPPLQLDLANLRRSKKYRKLVLGPGEPGWQIGESTSQYRMVA